MPETRTTEPTVLAEELADRLPYVATGVRVALETRDISGFGEKWARELAAIAAQSEQLCHLWHENRKRGTT